MDGRDVAVGPVLPSPGRPHIVDVAVAHLYPLCTLAASDLASRTLDDGNKQTGKAVAAADKPAGPLHVQGADDGVDVSRRLVRSASIERIHVGYDIAEPGIPDVPGDERIGCETEFGGMDREGVCGRAQMEEVDLVRKAEHGIDVCLKPGTLFGEMPGQRTDKSLPAPPDTVGSPVFGKVKAVGTVVVDITQLHPVCNAQILADAIDVAARVHSADDVHARIELHSEATEVLEAAAGRAVLLQHGNLEAFMGQESAGEKST